MKLRLPFLLLLFLSFQFCTAQISFQKTYGGIGLEYTGSAEQTDDGGYIIVGSGESYAAGYTDIYLIKTNPIGDTIWTKTYGSTEEDFGFSVKQTTDGGYIVLGSSSTDSLDSYGYNVIRTNSLGDSIWTKKIRYTMQFTKQQGYCIRETIDGGFIIVGVNSSSQNTENCDLIKLDAQGNLEWIQAYSSTLGCEGLYVEQTSDNGFIITGYTSITANINTDVYLFKTDSIGQLLWARSYGGNDYESGNAVQQTTDGGYILCGSSNSFGAGNADVYLVKTDSVGNMIWSKTFGGTGDDEGQSIDQTDDGGYIITGYTNSFDNGYDDVYLIKTDAIGDTLWTRTFGDTLREKAASVKQTSDGGYMIAGYSQTLAGGNYDNYLIKTDSDGHTNCLEHNIETIVFTPVINADTLLIFDSIPMVNITVPELITNSGGQTNILCAVSAVREVTAPSFLISPNPSTGNFKIQFDEMRIAEGLVTIYNVYGAAVLQQKIANTISINLDLQNAPAGIYFIKVFDGSHYSSRKIVIKH